MDFFVFEHLDGQRAQYSGLSEVEFSTSFEISEAIYQQFVAYFSETTKLENDAFDIYKSSIRTLLKSAFRKTTFWRQHSRKNLELI